MPNGQVKKLNNSNYCYVNTSVGLIYLFQFDCGVSQRFRFTDANIEAYNLALLFTENYEEGEKFEDELNTLLTSYKF